IDDAENPPALRGRGHHDFERICRGTENSADFRAVFDLIQDVDRERVLQVGAEHMPGSDGLKCRYAGTNQFFFISFCANKTGAGGLCKTDAESGLRHGGGDDFVKILSRLDEVGLAENYVATLGNFHTNGDYFHSCLLQKIACHNYSRGETLARKTMEFPACLFILFIRAVALATSAAH